MAQYLMLLWEDPASFAQVSAADMQNVIQEYIAWRKKIEAQGQFRSSAKLKDEGGKRIRGGSNPTVSDGPYVEAHEVIGGFFLVEAANYDAAVGIARSCPHLKYGWIEVREIEPT